MSFREIPFKFKAITDKKKILPEWHPLLFLQKTNSAAIKI